MKKHNATITLVSILFFLFGFTVQLNDILTPYLKNLFSLNYAETMLIQFTFFGCYFIASYPAGKLVSRFGHKNGFITGLLLMAAGCLILISASKLTYYALFLSGVLILAGGVTFLQVSANPYLLMIGNPKTASSRLIFAQALNSLGTTIAPIVGSTLILAVGASQALMVKALYFTLAVVLISYAVLISRFKFLEKSGEGRVDPPVKPGDDKKNIGDDKNAGDDKVALRDNRVAENFNLFKGNNWLLLGSLAIFFYVGAEVAIGSLMINFTSGKEIGNLPSLQAAGYYLPYYWGGAMIGRFAGSYLTKIIVPARLLMIHAVIAATLVTSTIISNGHHAMFSIPAVGLFNSIMFPTIFILSLDGLGQHTDKGSGILCMAIVGGAVIPLVQGYIADHSSLHSSYLIPLLCYIYIAFFAVKAHLRNGDVR